MPIFESCFRRSLLICILATIPSAAFSQTTQPTLRSAAEGKLLIGVAVRWSQLQHPPMASLVAAQFNSITAENEFKPMFLEPEPGQFKLEAADRIADFAGVNHQTLIGHTLCWHQQTPQWMYEDSTGKPLPRQMALEHLRSYITTVVQHFRGKVFGWDVANEAISNGPDEYLRDSPARRAIGDDYIERAFEYAHAADPGAELYYNDYAIEYPPKRDKVIRLIRSLKSAGIRIDAVGIQGHWSLSKPNLQTIEDAIIAFGKEGVKVSITELDIDVLPGKSGNGDLSATEQSGADPYKAECPQEILQAQAQRYADLISVVIKHRDIVERVTWWGVSDGQSWLNNYPVRGRTNYPLLWDRQLRPKPALGAVIDQLANATSP